MKFIPKNSIVDAYQVTDDWFDGSHPNDLHVPGVIIDYQTRLFYLPGFRNSGFIGDWIIIGQETVTLCDNTTFQKLYIKVKNNG